MEAGETCSPLNKKSAVQFNWTRDNLESISTVTGQKEPNEMLWGSYRALPSGHNNLQPQKGEAFQVIFNVFRTVEKIAPIITQRYSWRCFNSKSNWKKLIFYSGGNNRSQNDLFNSSQNFISLVRKWQTRKQAPLISDTQTTPKRAFCFYCVKEETTTQKIVKETNLFQTVITSFPADMDSVRNRRTMRKVLPLNHDLKTIFISSCGHTCEPGWELQNDKTRVIVK